MQSKKTQKERIDVIDRVLEACYQAYPDSVFIQSLMHQYEERGSLSKKQLEGAYQKALNVKDIPSNWLATMEATILKMPSRFKSVTPPVAPVTEPAPDTHVENLITDILAKYPAHKRVLFLQGKSKNKQPLLPAEIAELEKFKKLLLK